jgi:DNA-binding Lrp family transcriptional regulator
VKILSVNEENKDPLEALREEIARLRNEVRDLKSSLFGNESGDDDFFENGTREKLRNAKRKRKREHRKYHRHFDFRALEDLGNIISKTVCASVGDLNEVIEEVIGTISSTLENLDLEELFRNDKTSYRRKPHRWRYGEEPPAVETEEKEKPHIYLDEKEKMVLEKLLNEKLTFQELSESTELTKEDLENLIKYLKENGLLVQEFSGSQRIIITKYGKKHLSGET